LFKAFVQAGGAWNMTEPMREPVTKKRADRSTMDAFSFSFFCDICEVEWRSARYKLNPGDYSAQINSAIYRMLWNDQHAAAYERANRDARFEFNRCPMCGRGVCKDCFHLSVTGVSDICVDCLKSLTHEKDQGAGIDDGYAAAQPYHA
jgi:hypothetical protein